MFFLLPLRYAALDRFGVSRICFGSISPEIERLSRCHMIRTLNSFHIVSCLVTLTAVRTVHT